MTLSSHHSDVSWQSRIITIVGMYKCGTSWLSLALGKHPEAMALPELDVVRAFADESSAELPPRTQQERVRYLLSASNYGRMPAKISAAAEGLPADALYDYFEENASSRIFLKNAFVSQQLDRDAARALAGNGRSLNSFLNYWNLDESTARALFTEVIGCTEPTQAIQDFCRLHQRFAGGHLVLKSADQINHLDRLKQVLPGSRRILIIRDGRDMAVSAAKFEQYITERTHFSDIWGVVELGYWTRLEQWAHIARQINELAQAKELYLLRYEDLSADFEGTFSRLLDWLGLDASPQIVARIKADTSFEKMSGGRSKGDEDVSSNIRKGIVGEWRSLLSESDRERAWTLAGNELSLFGYGPD